MTALDLCYRVRAAGGTIRAEGDSLKLEAPEPLPDDLVNELKAHKPELLELLRRVVLFAPRRITEPVGTTPEGTQVVRVLNYCRAHADEDGMACCDWCAKCKRNGGHCRKADLLDRFHRCEDYRPTETEQNA